MATARDVLRIAASQIGYNRWDDPEPGTKFGRWYAKLTNTPYFGTNGVYFCAMGVSWVLNEAGQQVAGFPTASCTQAKYGASRAGLIISNKRNAKPGDIVIFDWDPANGNGVDHTGFVEKNCGSYIQTIEFNTSSGVAGSQSNGGGVYRRTRDWSVVNCIIRPQYDDAETTPTPKPTSHKVEVDGYFGHDSICELQYQLGTPQDGVISGQYAGNSCYFPRLMNVQYGVDGSQMVIKLQEKVGVEADGIIGKDTVVGIQLWLRDICGYKKHAIDGYLGENTAANMQNALNAGYFKSKPARKPEAKPAPKPAPKPQPKPKVNLGDLHYWGKKMTTELQKQLGTTADGIISGQWKNNMIYISCAGSGWNFINVGVNGSQCIAKLQARLGVNDDGIFGKATAKALQSYLIKHGYSVGKDGADGYFGSNSCVALGHALQDGLFR